MVRLCSNLLITEGSNFLFNLEKLKTPSSELLDLKKKLQLMSDNLEEEKKQSENFKTQLDAATKADAERTKLVKEVRNILFILFG